MRDVSKRRAVFNYYRTRGTLICLQETHSCTDDETVWQAEWKGDIFFTHGNTNSRGVCLLAPKGMRDQVTEIKRDQAGRVLIVKFTHNGQDIVLCNIYAPNQDTPSFFNNLATDLAVITGQKVIIGDFNLVLNVHKDRIGSLHNKEKSVIAINNMCEELLLSEIWRCQNPDVKRFSWYRCRPKLSASRIDFALISTGLVDVCTNSGYFTGIMSDHLAMYVYINPDSTDLGPGYWKLNCKYLQKIEYVNLINSTLDELKISCRDKSIVDKWEFMKYRIREVSMEYARNATAEINLIIAQLSEKITEFEADLPNADLHLLQLTKTDLDEFMQEKIKSCIFRSKANFVEFGERPSAYYLNLEKSKYDARTCNALYDDQMNLISTKDGILKLQESYYRKLYSSDDSIGF